MFQIVLGSDCPKGMDLFSNHPHGGEWRLSGDVNTPPAVLVTVCAGARWQDVLILELGSGSGRDT